MTKVSLIGTALLCLAAPGAAHAEALFSFSGKVALADGTVPEGTRAKLQVDLNRDGKLEKFETMTATVGANGSYELTYDLKPSDIDFELISFVTGLLADYEARGFASLLDDGPLPVVLTFEREGYATVVKRISSLFDAPSLDVVLAPLRDVQCVDGTCMSPDGAVQLSGFPGGTGIARAYANAYDPNRESAQFPGVFADDADNLLISSGFAEINLYGDDGKAVHELGAPVAARFEAKRNAWKTMPDLEPDSGRIELPMYSFDQGKGEWVREEDGELVLEDGSPVPEEALAEIRAGSFAERVFVSFTTDHFSSFNCDAPIEERACVKGRLVSQEGEPLPGMQVTVGGESYTGSAGTLFTAADGRFAADVMKSESDGEDVDYNGKRGETFSARVAVQSPSGVFLGAAFDTPRVVGSVQASGSRSCKPSQCDCLDLGDVVVEFEPPRLCEINVSASFSGKHTIGSGGPVARGEPVVGARIRASLASAVALPQVAVAELCQDEPCSAGTLDDAGSLRVLVPIVGDAPSIQLDADFSVQDGDTLHYYTGQATVTGCGTSEGALGTPVALELDHAAMGDLGAFIETLGDGPDLDDGSSLRDPLGCGCRIGSPASPTAPLLGSLLLVLGLGVRRRRRSHERA